MGLRHPVVSVMPHTWMSQVAHMNMSRHTYAWVTSHVWMSHVTHMNESCHTYEWVMSHTWMSQVARMNESRYTYGVALVSRIDKIIGLFCKRDLLKRRYSVKETYNLIDPTDHSHPIWMSHAASLLPCAYNTAHISSTRTQYPLHQQRHAHTLHTHDTPDHQRHTLHL